MHLLTKRVMRRIGVLGPKEEFNSEEWKSKIIFFSVQALYSVIVCIPTMWLYSSYTLSVIYISIIYLWCIWRGGTYYIEVFSERYKMKFIPVEKDHHDDEDIPYSRESSVD